MDILTQTEIILRDAEFETWTWTGLSPSVTCFESAALMGFVHVFDTVEALIGEWEQRQQTTLVRHAAALRSAGTKAWNVYSILLTHDSSPKLDRAAARIEENFSLTRKISRTSVRTPLDVERALLPLISIKAKPLLGISNFETRLRARLKDLPEDAVTALLSETPAGEVARILGASS